MYKLESDFKYFVQVHRAKKDPKKSNYGILISEIEEYVMTPNYLNEFGRRRETVYAASSNRSSKFSGRREVKNKERAY